MPVVQLGAFVRQPQPATDILKEIWDAWDTQGIKIYGFYAGNTFVRQYQREAVAREENASTFLSAEVFGYPSRTNMLSVHGRGPKGELDIHIQKFDLTKYTHIPGLDLVLNGGNDPTR